MIDIEYLARLLPILKQHGVCAFKAGDLEFAFQEKTNSLGLAPVADLPHAVSSTAIASEEPFVPPDLKADDSMDFDKVLNWSGSPDPDGELPLTGEGHV